MLVLVNFQDNVSTVKIAESRLGFFFIFLSHFYFIFNLFFIFSIFRTLGLELEMIGHNIDYGT